MFNSKIRKREPGIVLYGITPPKAGNSDQKTVEITGKTISRIEKLKVDGLVIYDLQDESSRTAAERPFPFMQTIDAHTYASVWLKDLNVSKIIYCSVGKLTEEQLLENLRGYAGENSTVFVGVPSKDHPVQLSLSKAYEIWKDSESEALLGAVAIPERHSLKQNEHTRILSKVNGGCSFFITQCVYNTEYVKNLVSDLYYQSLEQQAQLPYLIFTLTPCGSLKTLKFLDWLGIHVPQWLINELTHSHDILAKSVDLCINIAEEIIDFCAEKDIPFGLNIESVSIKKEEIEASGILLEAVTKMLEKKGIRKKIDQIA